jgi:hypothetical protein
MLSPWRGIGEKLRLFLTLGLGCISGLGAADTLDRGNPPIGLRRPTDGPVIHPGLDPSIGENIQGPSVIRVPDWVPDPLGAYYLYFADHKGRYIRLAYANEISGPWKIHVPGSLQIKDSFFLAEPPPISAEERKAIEEYFERSGIEIQHGRVEEVTTPHIASPDVHVDDENRRIIMYYHGLESLGVQLTRAATSGDGIHFEANPEILGRTYWRSFRWREEFYGLAMPGQFYRSDQPLTGYQKGPLLFNKDMRHAAVMVRGHHLWVFWTQVGETPERIKLSRIDLRGDWMQWRIDHELEVLRPREDWEGANAPLLPSVRSTAYGRVNQLRDPALYIENEGADDERIYLFYAVAGESGIGLVELKLP